MQWVPGYSGMEIILVPHSALVTPRAKYRQMNLLRQYIWKAGDTEGGMNGRSRRGQSLSTPFTPSHLITPFYTNRMCAFYFDTASG